MAVLQEGQWNIGRVVIDVGRGGKIVGEKKEVKLTKDGKTYEVLETS